MIQVIGLMIACYIITKMISLGTRDGERAESPVVRALALLTILVAIFGIYSLFEAGATIKKLSSAFGQ